MKSFSLLLTGFCLCASGMVWAASEKIDLAGPDGSVVWTLSVDRGKPVHSLTKGGKPVLEQDELGLVVDGAGLAEGIKGWDIVESGQTKSVKFPVQGKHQTGSVEYRDYTVKAEGTGLIVNARVFNDGLAFRYVWDESMKGKDQVRVNSESTAFRFPAETVLWTQDAGSALGPCEGVWSPSKISDFKVDAGNPRSYVRTAPITAELPFGGYALIQEAGNFGLDWSGIKFAMQDGACNAIYFHDQDGFSVKPDKAQPWRVVLVSDDLNGLVNSDLIESLVPSPDKSLFSRGAASPWIKPGNSSWTWWATSNAKNPDQYRFVDMASELGWDYHLVDEGWKKWDKDYAACLNMVKELVSYAAKKKVGVWVWIRWSDINNPDNDWEQMRTFLTEMKDAGVAGLKVDFMDSASQERLKFYDAMLVNTAKNELMINFHGSNTPGGEARTWPHEMSREGIYGGEQNKWRELTGQHLTALPFTRMVSGHADFTGGYFGHGKNLKGASWPLQMAVNIIYTSPVMHWVSTPDDMKAAFPAGSPQRELVEAVPTTWDETVVLPGAAIGEYAPFARRNRNQWFVALINGDGGERKEEIKLDFLPEGKYRMVVLSDVADRADGWNVDVRNVDQASTVPVTMRPRGGAVMWFVPVAELK